MTLALSKTMDLQADLPQLVEELAVVDAVGVGAQTPEARRWEYALALRALKTWETQTQAQTRRLVDVGGGGSAFRTMAEARGWVVRVVDPGETVDLATYLTTRPCLADAVVCLSVLEHVKDLPRFLYHLGCLVAPGGLLVLTMDCWDRPGPDTAHFHWMRERIFTVSEWLGLRTWFGFFFLLGELDPIYHDDQLYASYSIASQVLRKLD